MSETDAERTDRVLKAQERWAAERLTGDEPLWSPGRVAADMLLRPRSGSQRSATRSPPMARQSSRPGDRPTRRALEQTYLERERRAMLRAELAMIRPGQPLTREALLLMDCPPELMPADAPERRRPVSPF